MDLWVRRTRQYCTSTGGRDRGQTTHRASDKAAVEWQHGQHPIRFSELMDDDPRATRRKRADAPSQRLPAPDDDRATRYRSEGHTPTSTGSADPMVTYKAIDLPVYHPGRRRLIVVTGLIAVALAMGAGGWLVVMATSRSHTTSPAATRLAIKQVRVAITPLSGELRCGNGLVAFDGTISTNGRAGTLAYRWTYPDGRMGDPQTLNLANGVRAAHVRLEFSFTGTGSATGTGRLDITSPSHSGATSPTVLYRCP